MFISKPVLVFIGFLYVVGILFHLGYKPFNYKESKYAVAALEGVYNSSYLKPSVIGKPFLKHPPLYTIIESAIFNIATPSEFSARLISIVAFLIMGLFVYVSVADIVGFEAASFAVLGFLLSFGVYFKYSFQATPNALFSMFIFLSMVSMFLLNKTGIVIGFIFSFLAFLTYGFSALLFFYLFLFIYSFLKGKSKYYLLSKEHLIGVGFLIVSIVLYLFLVSQGNIHRVNYILGFMILLPIKNILSSVSFFGILTHFTASFIEILYYSLTFSLLFLLFVNETFRNEFAYLIKDNKRIKDLILFLISAFLPGFCIFAILPNAYFDLYIWLLPFVFMFIAVLFYELEYVGNIFDFYRIAYIAFFMLFALSAFCFIFDFEFVNSRDYVVPVAVLFISVLFFYMVKHKEDNLGVLFTSIILLSIFAKLLYSSSYVAYLKSYQRDYEKYANEISRIVLKNKPEYVMSDGGNLKLFFYLERKLKMPVYSLRKDRYGIVITKTRRKVAILKGAVDTPSGVYYIGIKNGGV